MSADARRVAKASPDSVRGTKYTFTVGRDGITIKSGQHSIKNFRDAVCVRNFLPKSGARGLVLSVSFKA